MIMGEFPLYTILRLGIKYTRRLGDWVSACGVHLGAGTKRSEKE
jgi:hypothetical protein